ncbi:hypothetical protein T492DRAFT_847705 [Pavlovales sp. CCMP2436]|nr:hypothetical protein T492DRAFT_847705 [Pavlovales sp. CCMP2436]
MDEALPSITVHFPLLSASALLSLLLIHIGAYLRFRSLRRHQASLVFGGCRYDLLFCLQLAYQLTRIKTAAECKAAAALMQFSMLASESCFLGISMDLRHALTQPFHDYKLTRRSCVEVFLQKSSVISPVKITQI